MLTAILADIHANREAFVSCLAHAREAGAERFVLLGDYVGYGADPEWSVERVRTLVGAGAVALKGNHDAAIIDGAGGMSGAAAACIEWTRPLLDVTQRAFLHALPLTATDGEALFVHANAWAPADWDYVRQERDAERCLQYAPQRIVFCGHVHVPALYAVASGKPAQRFTPPDGLWQPLVRSRRWLVVVGAVGQPRDGRPVANYCLWDARRNEVSFERVAYDVESAARKVEAAGLPTSLPKRLREGK
jgi:diadenosine tetraphosphatase ApaH/serine/threonine PP2A family protein phosphatase